jgi:pyruvate dehydrogenase E1 component beta subunit
VVIAEEGVMRGGVGAEIAARLQDECFGYLDAPIVRVGAKSCPIPTVEHLEKEVLPQVEDIILAARKTLL